MSLRQRLQCLILLVALLLVGSDAQLHLSARRMLLGADSADAIDSSEQYAGCAGPPYCPMDSSYWFCYKNSVRWVEQHLLRAAHHLCILSVQLLVAATTLTDMLTETASIVGCKTLQDWASSKCRTGHLFAVTPQLAAADLVLLVRCKAGLYVLHDLHIQDMLTCSLEGCAVCTVPVCSRYCLVKLVLHHKSSQ
jgi:hypothetical protein